MTRAEFQALFPEFGASTYNTRIDTLLLNVPDLDTERAGNQLNMALGNWVAGKLARQDFAIQFGASASMGSSNTVEKKVGEVSIKRSTSQSASNSTGAGRNTAKLNLYEAEYDRLIREFGMGAAAVGIPEATVVA